MNARSTELMVLVHRLRAHAAEAHAVANEIDDVDDGDGGYAAGCVDSWAQGAADDLKEAADIIEKMAKAP